MANTIAVVIDNVKLTNDADEHTSTDWQIASDSNFNNIIHESLDDSTNLYSYVYEDTAGTMTNDVYIRARARAYSLISEWMPVKHIKDFLPTVIASPTITVAYGLSIINRTPHIATSEFAVTQGKDTHQSTDWVIKDSSNIVVWNSIADATNLIEIDIPDGYLIPNETYTIEVVHNGVTGFGSNSTTFTVNNLIPNTWISGASSHYLETSTHQATCLYGDKIITSGGTHNSYSGSYPHNYVTLYDPYSDTREQLPDMPLKLKYHTQAVGGDGNLYVFGGQDKNSNTKNTIMKLNMTTMRWSIVLNNIFPVYSKAVTLDDGRIFIMRASNNFTSALIYDPVSNAITSTSQCPQRYQYPLPCKLDNGKVIIVSSSYSYGSRKVVTYDPATDSWTDMNDFPIDIQYGSQAFSLLKLNSGKLMFIFKSYNYFKTPYIYYPDTDTWAPKTDLLENAAPGFLANVGNDKALYIFTSTYSNTQRIYYILDSDLI
jgi:hypothetical protein